MSGDHGPERTHDTPWSSDIAKNIKNWMKKWSAIGGKALILNQEVVKAVQNLMVHIERGCLSGITPGCGTN